MHLLLTFHVDLKGQKDRFHEQKNPTTGRTFKAIDFDSVLRYESASLMFSVEIDNLKIGVSPKVEYQHVLPPMMRQTIL